ncbi:MAG: hypothetical protein LBI80_05435 [Endomicrobium sp.]|jgi:hypothetical protein|nr:hypothetical protein [Endomicrobium sp.]
MSDILKETLSKDALFIIGVNYNELSEEQQNYLIETLYEQVLTKALTNYNWGFAKRFAKLEQLTQETGNGYLAVYELPKENFLKLNEVYLQPRIMPVRDYERIGGLIYCDVLKTIFITYLGRPSEDEMSQQFKEYFKYELALECCYNYTGDDGQLQQLLITKMRDKFNTAINIESTQNKAYSFKYAPYVDIRD